MPRALGAAAHNEIHDSPRYLRRRGAKGGRHRMSGGRTAGCAYRTRAGGDAGRGKVAQPYGV